MGEWLGLIGAVLGSVLTAGVSWVALGRTLETQTTQHRQLVQLDIDERRADRRLERRRRLGAAAAEVTTTTGAVGAVGDADDGKTIAPVALDRTADIARRLMGRGESDSQSVMTYLHACRRWNAAAQILNSASLASDGSTVGRRGVVRRELVEEIRPALRTAGGRVAQILDEERQAARDAHRSARQ